MKLVWIVFGVVAACGGQTLEPTVDANGAPDVRSTPDATKAPDAGGLTDAARVPDGGNRRDATKTPDASTQSDAFSALPDAMTPPFDASDACAPMSCIDLGVGCGLTLPNGCGGLTSCGNCQDGGAPGLPIPSADAGACGAPWVVFWVQQAATMSMPNPPQFYAERADGTDGHFLSIPGAPGIASPTVSADGTALVYFASQGQNYQLSLYRFSDQSVTALDGMTDGPPHGAPPALSADGTLVAFYDGEYVRLAPTDGTPGKAVSTLFSPGGMAFFGDSHLVLGNTDRGSTVDIIDFDGGAAESLITGPSWNDIGPPGFAFSPDASQLLASINCTDGGSGTDALIIYPFSLLPASCASGTTLAEGYGIQGAQGFPGSMQGILVAWGPDGYVAYSASRGLVVINLRTGGATNLGPAGGPSFATGCANL